jgi:YggT family protein
MGVRDQIADFLGSLILVYTLIIIAWVVAQLVFSLGLRVPYSRWSNTILDFLRDVAQPYLRLFRWVPRIGPLDLSPMVAIIALQIVGGFVVTLIRGPA